MGDGRGKGFKGARRRIVNRTNKNESSVLRSVLQGLSMAWFLGLPRLLFGVITLRGECYQVAASGVFEWEAFDSGSEVVRIKAIDWINKALQSDALGCTHIDLKHTRTQHESLTCDQDTREEVIEAWYMDDSYEDQRLPHHKNPKEFVSFDQLAELGVLSWKLDVDNHETED
ncbi:hypothetical protein GH714_020366 [Hevea brasiliensis]|uniref:acireductone dioxygenase (Fe(2+)-requiring) n=1 Tax=Hevea brasiliensis TaxID=3981 RepID=A0A6A6K6I7_HEVBR|nr:hypothetical protein GH714_020366 [Hevea brasiliensis]